MLKNSIFARDPYYTDWFDMFDDLDRVEKKLYGHHAKEMMKVDIKDKDDKYEMILDIPGFKKEEVQVSMENGYLTIAASKGIEEENNDKYIRKERYEGSMERSFYVGNDIRKEDVKATFEHGVLRLSIPKSAPQIESSKYIEIE